MVAENLSACVPVSRIVPRSDGTSVSKSLSKLDCWVLRKRIRNILLQPFSFEIGLVSVVTSLPYSVVGSNFRVIINGSHFMIDPELWSWVYDHNVTAATLEYRVAQRTWDTWLHEFKGHCVVIFSVYQQMKKRTLEEEEDFWFPSESVSIKLQDWVAIWLWLIMAAGEIVKDSLRVVRAKWSAVVTWTTMKNIFRCIKKLSTKQIILKQMS